MYLFKLETLRLINKEKTLHTTDRHKYTVENPAPMLVYSHNSVLVEANGASLLPFSYLSINQLYNRVTVMVRVDKLCSLYIKQNTDKP